MKFIIRTLLIFTAFLLVSCTSSEEKAIAQIVPGVPAMNIVTFLDLGSSTCVPCKLMAPILEELKEEYKGRVAVIYIDVFEEANRGKAQIFAITSIPTQIFFDKSGNELYRHAGFLDKDSIVRKLDEILAL